MKNKYVFVSALLLGILLVSLGLTSIYVRYQEGEDKQDGLRIVTSFYPMYIATLNIVQDVPEVALYNLSEPQTGCLHDFQLTTGDMQLLSTADVFIINGGGIEGFMEEVASAYPNLLIVDASKDIALLGADHEQEEYEEHEHEEHETHEHEGHNHGDLGNAHVWLSVELYRRQVENIALALEKADVTHEKEYREAALAYDKQLEALASQQQELKQLLAEKSVVLFHEGYEYIAQDYGLQVAGVMNLDEERQVSAGEVADIIAAIEQEQVQVILAEEQYGAAMAQTLQRECQVEVLFLDTLNRGAYEADRYVLGMQHNMELLQSLCR